MPINKIVIPPTTRTEVVWLLPAFAGLVHVDAVLEQVIRLQHGVGAQFMQTAGAAHGRQAVAG